VDCDRDTILLRVEQIVGAACHTGYRTCFFQKVRQGELVPEGESVFDPKEIYGK